MKRYTDKTFHDLKGFAHTAFSEEINGEWVKYSDVEQLQEDLKEAYEYIDNPYGVGDWERDSLIDKVDEHRKESI